MKKQFISSNNLLLDSFRLGKKIEASGFKPDFLVRGLLVDIEHGNVLKVDGHKYVKKAYQHWCHRCRSSRDTPC